MNLEWFKTKLIEGLSRIKDHARDADRPPLGVSLAETLIALGLLGTIVLPMFMFSYSDFASILVKDRDKLAVAHSVSLALNRMATELSMSKRLLNTSTTSAVYFSYYDPIKATVVNRGYQLSANGSGKKLERLDYTSGSWVATSPYPNDPATAYTLPNSTQFSYCAEADCTLANAYNALSVKLSGWSFYRTAANGGMYTLTLPTYNMYLSSGLLGEVLVTETPRELYNVAGSLTFGSGSDLNLTFLSPNGTKLSNASFSTSASTTTPGTLTTIYSSATSSRPGKYSTMVQTSTGRVFFGNTLSHYFTWLASTGLSTLITEANQQPGYDSAGIDQTTGRIFVGSTSASKAANNNIYSWNSGTLKTILSSANKPGYQTLQVASGRVYFGEDDACLRTHLTNWSWGCGGSVGGFYTITYGVTTVSALSTILSNGMLAGTSSQVDPATGRVFFNFQKLYDPGDGTVQCYENYYTYSGSALTTIMTGTNSTSAVSTGCNSATSHGIDTTNAGGYYYDITAGSLYFWKPNTKTNALGADADVAINTADARAYYLNSTGTNIKRFNGNTNAVTTFLANSYSPVGVDPVSGAIYYASGTTLVRADSTGSPITTIATNITAIDPSNGHEFLVDSGTGRVFFQKYDTAANNGSVYTYLASTGLTTISSGRNLPSVLTYNATDGRLYFNANHTVQAWRASDGLETLLYLSAGDYPGEYDAIAYDSLTGRAFFGDATNFYTWLPGTTTPGGTSSGSLTLADANGSPSGQSLSLQYNAGTYVAACQDIQGELYLVNATDITVDRYHFSGATDQFSRVAQMNWTTWATTVGACAVDQSNTNIALLDTGNKQIDVYANRTTNGTPAAPTSLSLATLTTPTGLAINGRTGDYLVLDSALQSGTSVRLFLINGTTAAVSQTITIDVSSANLSVDATAETSFKIAYNDQTNILYLIAPNVGYIYALSLSAYL